MLVSLSFMPLADRRYNVPIYYDLHEFVEFHKNLRCKYGKMHKLYF